MAGKTRQRVKAAMIVVKVPGAQGGEAYLKKGRFLPDAIPAAEVKRLKALGLIETVAVEEPTDGEPRTAATGAQAEG